MLDPICSIREIKEKNLKKLAPKTMVRFCKGDPVLVTGDINGDIDVYRLNSKKCFTFLGEESTLEASYQR